MVARKKTAKRVGRPPKVGQGLWENPPQAAVVPTGTAVDAIDVAGDLDQEQREMFAELLRKNFSLEERAKQLVDLAKLTDTKRAAVGLRAIQEINAITGVHDGTSVSVKVEKVIK
jgi:isoaspartyl peptidase/L-asparaginase-like protein (Ntn-hydrolase superfamily)